MKMMIAAMLLAAAQGAAALELAALKNGAPLAVEIDPRMDRELLILDYSGGAALLLPDEVGVLPVLAEYWQRCSWPLSGAWLQLSMEFALSYDGRSIWASVTAPPDKMEASLRQIMGMLGHNDLDPALLAKSREQCGYSATGLYSASGQGLGFFARRDLYKGNQELLGGECGPKAFKALDLERVIWARKKLFDEAHLSYAAVGPMKARELAQLIDGLAGRAGSAYEALDLKHADPLSFLPPKPRIRIWNRPSVKECQIVWIAPAEEKVSPALINAENMVSLMLGNGLNGFMGKELRGKRGWTYYANSYLSFHDWVFATQCDEARMGDLLSTLPSLMQDFQKGPFDAAAIQAAQMNRVAGLKRRNSTPWSSMLWSLAQWHMRGQRELDKIMLAEPARPEDVAEAAKALNFSRGGLYIMGDEGKVRSALKQAPWTGSDIGILDTDGL